MIINALTLIGAITTGIYMFRAAHWLWKNRKHMTMRFWLLPLGMS